MKLTLILVLIPLFRVGAQDDQILDRKGRRQRERIITGVNAEGSSDGSTLTIHQAQRSQLISEDNEQTNRVQGVSREALRERLDSIILILSRLGDRMVSMETKQNQQTERIDNINYRITKLEVQGEEYKSKLNDLSVNFDHRFRTTDNEIGRLHDQLEGIKTAIEGIATTSVELRAKVDTLRQTEDTRSDSLRGGPRLQAVLTAVFGVKAHAQTLQASIEAVATNISALTNTSRTLGLLGESLVTKKDLHLSLSSLKTELGQTGTFPYSIFTSRTESKTKKAEATDCWELYHKRGKTKSGVYRIQTQLSHQPFFVFCDMETDGGGWTVVQRREDGTVDFARGWTDYKNGFGNLAGEFWLGNEKLFQITNDQVNELKIRLGDFSQTFAEASYKAFAIGPESEGYALKLLSGYNGDAGDSLSYHTGQKWSTYDLDNDAWPDQNCARDHTGAWWYKSCETSNLNGRYLHGPTPPDHEYKGVYWYDFHGPQYSLWQSIMMIRRGGSVERKEPVVPPHIAHSPDIPHPLQTGNDLNPDEDPLLIFQH